MDDVQCSRSVKLTKINVDYSRLQICDHFFHELRAGLITFIFCLLTTFDSWNVHEFFSSNCAISQFYAACCIDKLSRGSILGYEILTNN